MRQLAVRACQTAFFCVPTFVTWGMRLQWGGPGRRMTPKGTLVAARGGTPKFRNDIPRLRSCLESYAADAARVNGGLSRRLRRAQASTEEWQGVSRRIASVFRTLDSGFRRNDGQDIGYPRLTRGTDCFAFPVPQGRDSEVSQ